MGPCADHLWPARDTLQSLCARRDAVAVTRPLRSAGSFARWIRDGSRAWLTLTPGCRPRRIARRTVNAMADWIRAKPQRRALARRLISRFPRLAVQWRKRASAPAGFAASIDRIEPAGPQPDVSMRARQIHAWLYSTHSHNSSGSHAGEH